ncbi:MAG: helix-turn-helix domain-containing protein [Egibacteraceae bacterium]
MSKWTKAQVNRLRELMAAQRRAIDEVAEELRYRCGCSKLAAYRMAYGWSQPEAAERYTKATGGFMGQPLLSRLEQFPSDGVRAPLASQLIGFAAVYGTTPLQLVAPDVLEQLDARERAALIRCNAAFAPASQPDGTAAGHLGSLERVEIPDLRRSPGALRQPHPRVGTAGGEGNSRSAAVLRHRGRE